ncbi:MAG: MATE family efflux transporter, partial [Bacteroidales bacterium]|nr:MATE family efflux transporter [Bacteroidales bacterium]
MKQYKKNLTSGRIGKQLINLTWPMMFGMLGMVIFNLADTYFIGKLGVQQLAAISFSFPVIMLINSLSHGIGIGTASLISRNIVSSDHNIVRQMSSRAIFLGIIIVAIFITIGLLTIKPLFTLLGADAELIIYIKQYMDIWYYGVAFVIIPMIGNNIIRATGDTFWPGMLMVLSAIVNIILDPLLIFGYGPFPEMGIKGAALATVIARSTSLIFILVLLIHRNHLITLKIGKIKEIFSTWKKVLYIAFPLTLSMLITPISIGFITKIISTFGNNAVAAFGVASRIEMFALMMIPPLGSVLIIFIGQNFSKHKFSRIFTSLKYAGMFSLTWGFIIFLLTMFFAKDVASIFSNNTEVTDIAARYLVIVGMSYGFQGLVMLSTAAFNGINKPMNSAFFSILRMLGLYVPLAWIGSKIFFLDGIFFAAFIANIITGILAYVFLFKNIKKLKIETTPKT